MPVSQQARTVIQDLERRRRLNAWRRMLESYADRGLINRRHLKCPRCGRMVELLCTRCLADAGHPRRRSH